jgi:hypothetical protein
LVALVGLALVELDPPVAVILAYYGLLFWLATPLLRLRARTLGVLAAVWCVLGPVASHVLRVGREAWPGDQPGFAALAAPGELLRELTLTGYYPVLPWLTYLLAGWRWAGWTCGHRGSRPAPRRGSGGGGGGVGGVGAAAGPGRRRAGARLGPRRTRYGTVPTDTWWWLAVEAPHTGTPFDLAHTTGTALACWGDAAAGQRRAGLVWPLAAVGAMPLTLYTLHVTALALFPAEAAQAVGMSAGALLVTHLLAALVIGVAVRAARAPRSSRGDGAGAVRWCATGGGREPVSTPRRLPDPAPVRTPHQLVDPAPLPDETPTPRTPRRPQHSRCTGAWRDVEAPARSWRSRARAAEAGGRRDYRAARRVRTTAAATRARPTARIPTRGPRRASNSSATASGTETNTPPMPTAATHGRPGPHPGDDQRGGAEGPDDEPGGTPALREQRADHDGEAPSTQPGSAGVQIPPARAAGRPAPAADSPFPPAAAVGAARGAVRRRQRGRGQPGEPEPPQQRAAPVECAVADPVEGRQQRRRGRDERRDVLQHRGPAPPQHRRHDQGGPLPHERRRAGSTSTRSVGAHPAVAATATTAAAHRNPPSRPGAPSRAGEGRATTRHATATAASSSTRGHGPSSSHSSAPRNSAATTASAPPT